jgi:hypothetical protein
LVVLIVSHIKNSGVPVHNSFSTTSVTHLVTPHFADMSVTKHTNEHLRSNLVQHYVYIPYIDLGTRHM